MSFDNTTNAYILGSGLRCCLDDPANILEGRFEPPHVEYGRFGTPIRFPYHEISNPGIETGAERLFTIASDVVAEALNQARIDSFDASEVGIFVGSTSFSIFQTEAKYAEAIKENPEASPMGLTSYNALTEHIRSSFAPGAETFTFHTACTSSANALLYASRMIKSGRLKYGLVVGLEFFNEITMMGFQSLDLISKTNLQPFGRERDGIMLGEGCSAILLGAGKPDGEHVVGITGGFTMVDTDSMTAVNPDGSSVVTLTNRALADAGIGPEDVRSIKLHGTASLANDEAESIGLSAIFDSQPPCCVLKPAIGHTLGACGTNELIILGEYLKRGCLPGLPYEYPLDDELGVFLPVNEQSIDHGYHLLNHYGFGGNNTAIVIADEVVN